jgi:hypothetical protein
MTETSRSTLVAGCVLLSALCCPRSGAAADDDRWIGREFTPRTTCQPMIGNRLVPLQDLPRPFKVERVSGDWLWVGQAWVKKQDVVLVEDPIEEFDVARHGDFLLVPVTIDGRKYEFLVDTASTWSVVDTTLESHLEPTGKTTRVNGSPGVPIYQLPPTHVGTSRLPVTGRAVCFDLEPFRKYSGHNIRGLLGMTFLKDKILRIDFDRGKLAVLRSPPAHQKNSFALSYSGWRLPLVTLELAPDRPVSFELDTGMHGDNCGVIGTALFATLVRTGDVTLTGREVGALTIDGEDYHRLATLKELRLGAFRHARLRFREGERNILGLGYLARFQVTFDFRNDRIYLQKGAGFDSREGEDRFGAALFRVANETYVERVWPSSPAGESGLKDGDRIVLIDGTSPSQFSLFELDKQLGVAGRLVQMVVQDDAEPRAVTVRLADWKVPSTVRREAEASPAPISAGSAGARK